ncbi:MULTISPECIES: pantetheine-phosphate adenylyltransferase [Olsenella]|uniref:pantetheine-phosphate adenylyltransferase n=1 Tax=Olsenella TaxID=133925 RepID=UPI00071E3EAA|nr:MULTISPECIES: pantetheine-phosphate adenylyltransferase [Olsenella]OFK24592.1 pantetheine-phosphate adenylyltransferase [Olsenella sp. HMSC062G07]
MRKIIEHVVVPGTFDPVTLGHLDVIARTRNMFPKVTVAVAASVSKNGTGTIFSLDERVQLVSASLRELGLDDGVDVLPFSGLLMDLCRELGAGAVVKGLRAMTDFEYELGQADLNYHLAPEVESIFVMGSPTYGYISSSIVRELASMGGDISFLVTDCVKSRLKEHARP